MPAHGDSHCGSLQRDAPQLDKLAIKAVTAASQRAHTRHELGQRKRFDDVVIGAAGPYAGFSFGMPTFDPGHSNSPRVSEDRRGGSLKVFGGYRFNEYFGVEAGYARLAKMYETVTINGADVTQKARAQSFYSAVTGSVPVTGPFSLTGKVGMSQKTSLTLDYDRYGKVSDQLSASAVRFGVRMAGRFRPFRSESHAAFLPTARSGRLCPVLIPTEQSQPSPST